MSCDSATALASRHLRRNAQLFGSLLELGNLILGHGLILCGNLVGFEKQGLKYWVEHAGALEESEEDDHAKLGLLIKRNNVRGKQVKESHSSLEQGEEKPEGQPLLV